MLTSVPVGQQFPDPLHRGPLLPVGAQLSTSTYRGSDRFTLEAPGLWVYRDSIIDPSLLMVPLYLLSAGDLSEVELPPETVSEFRWRVRDVALAAAERSNVHQSGVMSIVNGIGAVEPRFTVGGIVASGHDLRHLPSGSVVYAGHPDRPKLMSVWEMDEYQNLQLIWGRAKQRQPGQGVTIYSMPTPPTYPEEKPAVDDTLLRLAQRVYRLGKAAQQRHSWCSIYSNALQALGITEELVSSVPGSLFGPGEEVGRHEAAGLPEGSLLYWSWQNRDAVAVYVRDDSMTRVTSRTRRLWGWNDDESNSHERMTVMSLPGEELLWSVNGQTLHHLPAGVVFRSPETGPTTLNSDTRGRLSARTMYTVTGWPL